MGKIPLKQHQIFLKQTQGYTSAVFHGNSGTFWNRNETYKRLGYDYFFDASYYNVTEDNSFQYGLNDKPFFQQSVKYLEHLQQPFYTKFIAVSNHYPYSQLSGDETGFPLAQTKDETINSYFSTANYMDTAVHEFFDYLKQSGLYDNSIIILYGDHYGISNARNKELAQLLGKDRETWSNFDNAQVQRVPYMIHIPGMNKGKIIDTYGGQVDALPTLLHLLGVDTQNYIQLGQDLFSPDHKQLVAFRDGDFVTPNYTYYGGILYDNKTGEEITEPSEELKKQIDADKEAVSDQLATSDKINNGDLLRFYTKSGLKAINPDDYNYLKNTDRIEKIEKELGDKSTSVYSKHNHTSTTDKYQTKSYQELHPKETSSSTSSENE